MGLLEQDWYAVSLLSFETDYTHGQRDQDCQLESRQNVATSTLPIGKGLLLDAISHVQVHRKAANFSDNRALIP